MKKKYVARDITPSEINTWEMIENTLIQAATDLISTKSNYQLWSKKPISQRSWGIHRYCR